LQCLGQLAQLLILHRYLLLELHLHHLILLQLHQLHLLLRE
jgi:hypothetical protein